MLDKCVTSISWALVPFLLCIPTERSITEKRGTGIGVKKAKEEDETINSYKDH